MIISSMNIWPEMAGDPAASSNRPTRLIGYSILPLSDTLMLACSQAPVRVGNLGDLDALAILGVALGQASLDPLDEEVAEDGPERCCRRQTVSWRLGWGRTSGCRQK